MGNDNRKVPVAVLSCFLIAFIMQGTLKLCGVLVFEKALDWRIFAIIDNHKYLQIIYYSLIALITVYCLSFALTRKAYSKRWYHYLIMVLTTFGITAFRMLGKYTIQQNIIMDIVLYIIIPFIISITIEKDDRLFSEYNVFGIVSTLTINIALYLCYLGLTYWSGILNSLFATSTLWLNSSTMFLINFEIYIGLITFMLSINILIVKLKEKKTMFMPVNIASKKAKLNAKKEVLEKKLAIINEEIAKLDAKENNAK